MAKSAVLLLVATQISELTAATSSQQDAVTNAISVALKSRQITAGDEKLASVETSLFPTFQALSKNSVGRLGSQEVGYTIQRYFSREHGLRLTGLDASFSGMASESNATGEDRWLLDSLTSAMRATRSNRGLSAGDVALVAAAVEEVVLQDQRGAKTTARAKMQQQSCEARREALAGLCEPATGRLSLSAVSAGAAESFDGSALHAAGAAEGSRVLLANYLAMPMHCTTSTELYAVCCVSACESIASSIESKALGPRVSADRLLQIVSKEAAPVPRELERQLDRIAQQQGGDVSLHSDEFSEWLHYAFPNSCPLRSSLALTEHAALETFTAKEMLASYIGRSAATGEATSMEPPATETTAFPEETPWYRSGGARMAVFGLLAFAMLRNVVSQFRHAGGAIRGETDKDAKKAAKA